MYIQHPLIGAFSIVQALHRPGREPDPSRLVLRGRVAAHMRALVAACPALKPYPISESNVADYRFRIVAPRQVVLEACLRLVELVTYQNAKNAASLHWGPRSAEVKAMFETHHAWAALQRPALRMAEERAWWERRSDEVEPDAEL